MNLRRAVQELQIGGTRARDEPRPLNPRAGAMISREPMFRIEAELADILHLGHTPYGDRRIINILGGKVHGPRLSGRILSGGADWQIVRPDGVADLRARYTIETDRGA